MFCWRFYFWLFKSLWKRAGEILKVNETQPFIKIGQKGLRLVVERFIHIPIMLANHWFRDVNDVRSEPMGFQIQMPLEPKGKPSSPFTKPHSSFECRRESIYWSVRAHCILLGLKSETFFQSTVRGASSIRWVLTLIPQIFIFIIRRSLKYLFESGCFAQHVSLSWACNCKYSYFALGESERHFLQERAYTVWQPF